MEQKKPKKSHFSLVELMVCVAVLAIAASVTIPRYMTHVFQERQAECASALRALHSAQKAYFERHGRYTADLGKLAWEPPQKPIYLYGFRSMHEGDVAQGAITVTPHPTLLREDLPDSYFNETGGYRIGCVGNIDSDPTLDRFSIDQNGQLAHISNDLD